MSHWIHREISHRILHLIIFICCFHLPCISAVESYKLETNAKIHTEKPFPDIADDVKIMRVNPGTKISNVMGYATKQFMKPEVQQIVWTGSGVACSKVITCAEIFKNKNKNTLHQVTNIAYQRSEDHWTPTVDGLDSIKVNKDVPSVSILLSKSALDATTPGYQAPGVKDAFWSQDEFNSKQAAKEKAPKSKPYSDSKFHPTRSLDGRAPSNSTDKQRRQRENQKEKQKEKQKDKQKNI